MKFPRKTGWFLSVAFHMKSGNIIRLDRVEEFEVRSRASDVTYFAIKQCRKAHARLNVPSINLAEVEAITSRRTWRPMWEWK